MRAVENNFDDLKVNELLKKHFIELRSVSPAGSTHVLDIDGLKDKTIKCSLHGSYFDLETGEALNEPADEPIKAYKTFMKDNNICIEL